MSIFVARILRALSTILISAAISAAPGNRTSLVAKTAAAAVAGYLHGTEPAVQAAERQIWILSCKTLHNCILGFLLKLLFHRLKQLIDKDRFCSESVHADLYRRTSVFLLNVG